MIMLAMQVSHFTAAVTFAFFTSIVFGITSRSTPRDMFRYGAYIFAWMVLGMWAFGWFMWFLHH